MSAQTLDPAPAVPTQPAAGYDEVIIHVRRYPGRRGVEIFSPHDPNYVVLAHGATQIAAMIEWVWCDKAAAAYADRRGEVHDRLLHDEAATRLALQERQLREGQIAVLKPAADRRTSGTMRTDRRNRVHDIAAWRPLPAGTVTLRSGKVVKNVPPGSWESPAGRVYRINSDKVRLVVKNRIDAGLPVVPGHDMDGDVRTAYEALKRDFPDWPAAELRAQAERIASAVKP